VLHTVHIIHNHLLLRGRIYLLRIHGLLGWVLHLLQMHFLVLNSRCFGAFTREVLGVAQSGLACRLALCGAIDSDCGLAMATSELLFRRASNTQTLSVVMSVSAVVPVTRVVHLGEGMVLLGLEIICGATIDMFRA